MLRSRVLRPARHYHIISLALCGEIKVPDMAVFYPCSEHPWVVHFVMYLIQVHLFSCVALIMCGFIMAMDFCCLCPSTLPVYIFLCTKVLLCSDIIQSFANRITFKWKCDQDATQMATRVECISTPKAFTPHSEDWSLYAQCFQHFLLVNSSTEESEKLHLLLALEVWRSGSIWWHQL